ncbi:T-cell surface protein tactile isoform X1 [Mobula hypostoma]|uniref:T-cell surface protein tactile isoform X1 n=1 Tax=Mobula hypostoma TaxID=723540 RepID=UPI002FC3D82F
MAEQAKHSYTPIWIFALINLVQAMQGLKIEYVPKVTASVGENVTLKCILSGQETARVLQIQWSGETIDHSLNHSLIIIANKDYGIYHFLDSVKFESQSPTEGMASICITNVQESAAGTYTCSVVTFPEGSFKVSIILTVIKKDLSTSSIKLITFTSQHTSWQDTESYSSTELTTSPKLPFVTDSSTTPAAASNTSSFTSAGLSTIFQESQSSYTVVPSINTEISNSPGPSFTNELSNTEGQMSTLQPLISLGSSTGFVKSSNVPIDETSLYTTMSWNRTIATDITKDVPLIKQHTSKLLVNAAGQAASLGRGTVDVLGRDPSSGLTEGRADAEDSVSLAVVVTVILILVICTALLSCLIRHWQVRRKLNAPPPFKPPPPPTKYTAIQV